MITYGDHVRRLDPHAELARLDAALRALTAVPPGLARHGELVSVFVNAAALLQAAVDAEFTDRGCDGPTPLHTAGSRALLDLARAVDASWRAGASGAPPEPAAPGELAALVPPSPLDARLAEGFAFYALYPEGHAEAARRAGLDGESRLLGLRSIGWALAAMAAAGAGAPAPLSARPVGHPFDRALRLDDDLRAALAADHGRRWAVADEGPGLSGSCFAAAVGALEAAGVAPKRIFLLPGHDGLPGAEAGRERRARYAAAPRTVVDLDALALAPGAAGPPLARWAQDVTGAPLAPLEEVTGGGWRSALGLPAELWPPVDPARARRTFRLRAERGTFRLKFTGLGAEGAAKLERGRALAATGFAPEPLALRHGFLVERWLEGARPLADTPADRAAAATRVGHYLAFRARAFPAEPWAGASLEALFDMAYANAAEALGGSAAVRLDRWRARLADLARGSRRVWTDARLHLWEWLRLPDGRVLKTDALDHARAHDLVGCQDIAWDVAGAEAELGLDDAAVAGLADRLGVPAPRLAFHRLAYLAFQLGLWTQAAQSQTGDEARRAGARAARYAEALSRALERPFSA